MNKAKMLGHDSHCDFILQEKMIGTQAAAREFLLDIHTRLAPLAKEELAALVALKQKDESAAAADKGVIHGWDTAYYSRILKEDTLGLDTEKIREYFPLGHVKTAIFGIYQEMLHVRFEKVEGGNVWHPEVELYQVRDVSTDECCGHFFLDLFSRDGKFGHQCVS